MSLKTTLLSFLFRKKGRSLLFLEKIEVNWRAEVPKWICGARFIILCSERQTIIFLVSVLGDLSGKLIYLDLGLFFHAIFCHFMTNSKC